VRRTAGALGPSAIDVLADIVNDAASTQNRTYLPWGVRLRNLRSTNVRITTTHVSRSMPSNRWACGSVTLSPGISLYSAWTRRVKSRTVATCPLVSGTVLVTMNVPRDSSDIVRGKNDSNYAFDRVARKNRKYPRGCELSRSRPGAAYAWRHFNLKARLNVKGWRDSRISSGFRPVRATSLRFSPTRVRCASGRQLLRTPAVLPQDHSNELTRCRGRWRVRPARPIEVAGCL